MNIGCPRHVFHHLIGAHSSHSDMQNKHFRYLPNFRNKISILILNAFSDYIATSTIRHLSKSHQKGLPFPLPKLWEDGSRLSHGALLLFRLYSKSLLVNYSFRDFLCLPSRSPVCSRSSSDVLEILWMTQNCTKRTLPVSTESEKTKEDGGWVTDKSGNDTKEKGTAQLLHGFGQGSSRFRGHLLNQVNVGENTAVIR